jgi:hypothetical protein
VAGGKRRLSMDIVASIVAYLTCVAGIIGAFAISIFVLFSTPDQVQAPSQTIASQNIALATKHSAVPSNVATLNGPQAATVTKPAAEAQTASSRKIHAALRAEKRTPSPQTTTAQSALPSEAQRKIQPTPAQLRHLTRQERDRHLAYQQDPNFEARFLGYAD